ncbi:centromere associated protein [Fusarium heterosporum]|uniref:CENP-C homolog n=1 Tax=Fusarium heterosporum TaxID=42747 RepID=A0A8H5X2L4_FUSHE|nr:centromere associated protein [Fusarium heterosporum]
MAPRGGARRSEVAEPQAFHQLGVRGRKTGVVLVDTGDRDEHGMQPLDDLLSSPEQESASEQRYDQNEDEDDQANDQYESGDNEDDDEEGSEDMDIDTSVGPGPQTVLRRSAQYPIPRSRSPIKTTLMSSPRRHPNVSSPTRAPFASERDATVTRKIDFGVKLPGQGKGATNGVNGDVHEEEDEEEDADETEDAPEPDDDVEDDMDLLNESMKLVEGMGGNSSEPETEPEPAPAPATKVAKAPAKNSSAQPEADPKKPGRRGRPPKAKPVEEPVQEDPIEEELEEPQEEEEPVKPRPGRKPKSAAQPKESKATNSRKRPAPEEPEDTEEPDNEATEPEPEEEEPRQTKRPRTEPSKTSKPNRPAPPKPIPAAEPKSRGRPGRKPKVQVAGDAGDDVGDTSFAALQRGPPLPKKRGLVSVRHDPEEVKTTRSGRHSFKPLSWWAGDKVVQEEEEFKDVSGRDRFVLSTIKEVIRAPQEEVRAKPSKGRGRAKAKSKPVRQVETVEPEEWEINPGVINGEVILWEPEHERNPPGDEEPVEVMEDRIAISGDNIQTRDVQSASFRMAKTLTTPFIGAGVVDLPPGSEKRPKNSRKMHMVFFVHTGKVLVTVNEASFRLSAGGMWFVPRGNYYSITNDYDTESRIFFSQGCEISAQPAEPDQSQMSMLA